MAAEQQLERSVLERKEREELRAIAQAMALDTNSRSKKADIIDQILRAAGVEVATAGSNGAEAPARSRAGSRRAATNGAGADEDTDDAPHPEAANGSAAAQSAVGHDSGDGPGAPTSGADASDTQASDDASSDVGS
ncbi:MAG: hypothetical protein ABSG81_12075, partial [Acidimicrobiales bacterium]